ncbi:hypothetical protein TNIN_90821 [Trichonephila inaurata madagascariensis]|uniref:Uncharacterized protein n=1 Tax=Trichonephila inaurata madagascariensis TaxID=2747483 RepID=A0A8X7CGX5_9ARAC|nr:hypothetical protein TNIN_90821 [Trichonephila inaurata madagascariensis]
MFTCLSPKSGKRVSQGRCKIVDEDQSRRPVLVSTKLIEQQVEELILADRRMAFDSIATSLNRLKPEKGGPLGPATTEEQKKKNRKFAFYWAHRNDVLEANSFR